MKFISLKTLTTFLLLFNSFYCFSGTDSNHAGIFLGTTTGGSSGGVTVGVEYERVLPYFERSFGVMGFLESISSEPKSSVFGLALTYSSPFYLKFIAGHGKHFTDGHSSDFLRLGIGYSHHIDQYSLTPSFSTDHSSHGIVSVYGIAFGVSF